MRGPWQNKGWLFYEFNWAICRIHQDEGFRAGQASKPEISEPILADLRAAATCELKEFIEKDVVKWLTQNSLTIDDLVTES